MQAVAEAPKQKKKKYLFQVLAGRHWEPGEVENDRGQKVIKDIKYGPKCPAGDIVESDLELDKLFNRPHSTKFQRVGEDGQRDARAEELKVEREKSAGAQSALSSALKKMSRAELVAWAEEQEIDLKGAQKHEDVLRAVLGTLG